MENSESSEMSPASNETPVRFLNRYDPEDVVERTFDLEDDTASESVVRALIDATGVSPLDLEPLYESVDPDAIDALVRRGDRETAVTFVHEDHYVTVAGTGRVVVAPKEAN